MERSRLDIIETEMRRTSSLFEKDMEVSPEEVIETSILADAGTRKFHAEAAADALATTIADAKSILMRIGKPEKDVQAALGKLDDVLEQYEGLLGILEGKSPKGALPEGVVRNMRDILK